MSTVTPVDGSLMARRDDVRAGSDEAEQTRGIRRSVIERLEPLSLRRNCERPNGVDLRIPVRERHPLEKLRWSPRLVHARIG
jgi:hypothetical protein